MDEANLRLVAPELQPQHIVVLNLFRDQLDRYGELDTTAAKIGQGIAATRAKAYLNADDALVASLAEIYGAGPGELLRDRGTVLEVADDSPVGDRLGPMPDMR